MPSEYYRSVIRSASAFVVSTAALAAAWAWVSGPAAASTAATRLTGTFELTAGSCAGGGASGTYIRMILPSGNDSSGPYFSNSDSTCSDQTYTLLSAGTDGGLITGSYQPNPNPAFSSSGDARADRITAPQDYYGTSFATSTNPVDPQTGEKAPAPTVDVSGHSLAGNLSAFSVAWNNQYFNQGSPKPGGTYPGNTSPVTGTYDPATGAFTLEWASQIVGGPFNNFTGQWHLIGHFVPAAAAPVRPGAQSAAPSAAAASKGGGPAPSPNGSTATAAAPQPVAGPTASKSAASSPAKHAVKGSTPTAASGVGTSASSPGTSPASPGFTTTVTRHGWRSPAWLVGVIASVGLVGLAALLLLESRIRAAAGETSIGWLSLRRARAAAAGVEAVSLIALAVLAILTATVTETRVAPRPSAALNIVPTQSVGLAAASSPVARAVAAPPDLKPEAAIPTRPTVMANTEPLAPAPTVADLSALSAPHPSAPPSHRPPTSPPGTVSAAVCPADLPAPHQTGGLQSMIALAPAFGPYSAEAFAMAPAFQPFLQLFGPLLAKFPGLYTQLQPVLGPLLTQWEAMTDSSYSVIGPLYAPHREQFLDDEVRLAGVIGPHAEKLAGSPEAACVIDIEGQLAAAG